MSVLISVLALLAASTQGRLLPVKNESLWEADMIEVPLELEPQNELLNRAAGCSIKIRSKEMKNPQPLLIKPGTAEFFPFSATGFVNVEKDKKIEFHCTSSLDSPLSGKFVTAKCVGGSIFKFGDKERDISTVKCTSWPSFVSKKSGSRCNGGTTLINVGFQLSGSRFAKQYDVCFNEDEEVTRYVYHTLEAGSNYYATGVDRINFGNAGFFAGKNVDKLYSQAVQKKTIDNALGMDTSRYFDSSKNVFLARGHMGAKADFVFPPEQRATFLFINAAPQWQTFNAGNWARVEDGVRAWVSKNKKRVDCWTGVWGVTTLPNKDGRQTSLYLAYDNNGNGLIPVPKLYFSVVIEPSSKKGIVFVGVNNPHLSIDDIKRDYILCNDVSDKINWISWKRTNILDGYSYACEVREFRKKVTHLPEFSVSGLLV